MKQKLLLIVSIFFVAACTENKLPILGNRTVKEINSNGKTITDTIYQTIPEFNFINQNQETVTNKNLEGKITVADFFFITCPTICPIMKKNLIKVYEEYRNDKNIQLISHTIDPEHDSIPMLKDYCERIGSDGKQWMFLWGNRNSIYQIAESGYFVSAMSDSTAPGGFVHSGGLILVDPKLRVRGIYDGTSEAEVNKLIKDIKVLKNETNL